MRWKTAHLYLLALVYVLKRQHHVEAAYSPAVVRIDTGSSNGPFTDAGGSVWSSDSTNNGGGSESTNTSTALGNTEDDQATVYQTNRISTSFAYIFGPADGLMPGQTYTLALHFVELYFEEEQQRVFDVQVLANKQMTQALTNFDIYHEAGGRYTAYTYQDSFTLGADGMLSIYFASSVDQASIAGIEILLPAVVRIDAGSTNAFNDELSPSPRMWQADGYFTGGGSGYQSGNIGNAADGSAGVYRTYHSAQAFTYTLGPENGLLPNTDYVAVLHFAELPDKGVIMQAGDRLMDVIAQGQDVLTSFDIFQEAGGAYTALRKHFVFTTDQTGVIMITFESTGKNHADAILAGLEVYPALKSVARSAPTLAPAPAPGLGPYVAAAPIADSPPSPLAASPLASPFTTPGRNPASSDDTASPAAPSQGTAGKPSSSNAASPEASPRAGPSMASAAPLAGSPAPSSAADMYKSLIESYLASLAQSPTGTSGASPVAAPTPSHDTSAAPAVSQRARVSARPAPSAQDISIEEDAAPSPAVAPAPGKDAPGDPAASPDPGMTATSPIADLALPPLPSLNAPSPAAPTADALVQACQDMYSTYVNVITAQTSILLSKNVLQPQQLTESYLAGVSAQHPVPSEQNPVYALLQGNDLEDYPACGDLNDLVQTYYDIIILLRQAGAPASAPALSTSQRAPATAPLAAEAPALAPMWAPAPQPTPTCPIINYDGVDMPGDIACQLMMADVNQGIESVIGQLLPGDPMVTCKGLAGFEGVCGQILAILIGAELDDMPTVEDMQEFGFTDPAQCPACVQYLKKNFMLNALLELSDQMMMAPAPAPTPDAEVPQTAPAMAPAPALMPPAASPASGPQPDPCAPRPVPTLVAPRYSSTTMVSFQLSFPVGYTPPSCAPDCLISLGCGEASLDPNLEGYSFSNPGNPTVQPNGNYPLTVYFPSAAQYPALGFQPPIITSCVRYAAMPCDSTALTALGDITFDATRPTVTISKVSEQYGDPTTSTATRKLQQTASSQPLFALMLFNFSKAVGNFSADDILLNGGTVAEIIPVPDTYEYFVWVQVTSGTASLHIAINPGSITDAAGNILYSDPTNPQIFTIVSSNGQYNGIITYPSPPPPPSTVSAMATAAARLLSKGAIAGIVIGVFFGVLIIVVIMAITFGILRRRRILQRESDIVANSKTPPPKTVTFTGPPGPGKSA